MRALNITWRSRGHVCSSEGIKKRHGLIDWEKERERRRIDVDIQEGGSVRVFVSRLCVISMRIVSYMDLRFE